MVEQRYGFTLALDEGELLASRPGHLASCKLPPAAIGLQGGRVSEPVWNLFKMFFFLM
jgi:hypothetical protein